MRDGELRKVVLAHDLTVTAESRFDPRFLLHGLAARYPTCWVFAVDGLVGATPELLLRREGSTVSSRVLAGTSWPRNGSSPAQLAAKLLGSAQDREEHRYAVESLADTLRPYCATLSVPDRPEILPLRNVLHLCTDIAGKLRGSASVLELAAALHPTAAVGGTPRAAGVALIRELERMDRGRYAGPVGWIDGSGDGELGIAIRCAQVDGAEVRLFAGCGIVADSEPDDEVAEAAAKFVPMRDAIEGLEG
jgi:menaquinone-specific isochorismate synthase